MKKNMAGFAGTLVLLTMITLASTQSARAEPVRGADQCQDYYLAQAGDTFASIARQYRINVSQLLDANSGYYYLKPRVGDFLCIPYPNFGGHSGTKDLHAKIVDFNLRVWGYNFDSNADYTVKISSTTLGASKRLGITGSDRQGNIADTFLIPMNFEYSPSFEVCLKEIPTNHLTCITIRNLYQAGNPPCYITTNPDGGQTATCISEPTDGIDSSLP